LKGGGGKGVGGGEEKNVLSPPPQPYSCINEYDRCIICDNNSPDKTLAAPSGPARFLSILPCNHCFHAVCLIKILKESTENAYEFKCPKCKYKILPRTPDDWNKGPLMKTFKLNNGISMIEYGVKVHDNETKFKWNDWQNGEYQQLFKANAIKAGLNELHLDTNEYNLFIATNKYTDENYREFIDWNATVEKLRVASWKINMLNTVEKMRQNKNIWHNDMQNKIKTSYIEVLLAPLWAGGGGEKEWDEEKWADTPMYISVTDITNTDINEWAIKIIDQFLKELKDRQGRVMYTTGHERSKEKEMVQQVNKQLGLGFIIGTQKYPLAWEDAEDKMINYESKIRKEQSDAYWGNKTIKMDNFNDEAISNKSNKKPWKPRIFQWFTRRRKNNRIKKEAKMEAVERAKAIEARNNINTD
jgi:hypothetical protein